MKESVSLVPHYIMLGIFFIAGAICFLSALANAKWFLNSRNLGFLRRYLSPFWIRIAYGVLGVCLMIIALFFYHNLQTLDFQKLQ